MNMKIISAISILSLAACSMLTDEGVSLGSQIAKAGKKLRRSPDSTMVILYEPREGVNQKYSVGIGAAVWCPGPPCPQNTSGLTVEVERGNHGSTTVHLNVVAVPKALFIEKQGEAVEVTLRKIRDTIQVVRLR